MIVNAARKMVAESKPTLVLGLGLTGYSVIRHLAGTGSAVTAADSREFPPYLKRVKEEFPGVEIITGEIPYGRFQGFSQIVASPGLDLGELGVAGTRVLGDIELFARQADAPSIGITGSNGKSTVTMLVKTMLQAAGKQVKAGGNIGTPALDLLDGEPTDFYVLELSSFQLESTHSLDLVSATVLNLSEDHMDRYGGLKEYARAKNRIFRHAGRAILNRDDPLSRACFHCGTSPVSFGLGPPENHFDFGLRTKDGKRILVKGKRDLVDADRLTLPGDHNIANILAAMALVDSAGVALTPGVVNAAAGYGGLPHRCEIVSRANGVQWMNDSKGTNVGATIAAIKGFSLPLILIAGGQGKGADFGPLVEVIAQQVKHTILFGEDARTIASAIAARTDESVEYTRVASLEEAVSMAKRRARPGWGVLFSPACASFDLFDNYVHRGNVFRNLVLEGVH